MDQAIPGFWIIFSSHKLSSYHRSQQKVIQLSANLYTVAPMLTTTVIYNTGCLLAKFVRPNFQDESKKQMNLVVVLHSKVQQKFVVLSIVFIYQIIQK